MIKIEDMINNVKVYGFDESVKASKYPMSVDIDKIEHSIKTERQKQNKLHELMSINAISNDDLKRMNFDIGEKVIDLNETLSPLGFDFFNITAVFVHNLIDDFLFKSELFQKFFAK